MACKVDFICEGQEEVCFIDSLLKVGAFNPAYEIFREDAGGFGNVPIYFDRAFQSDDYDAVFAVVDVDRFSNGTFAHVVESLQETLGFPPYQIILFTNPCTIQLFLAARSDDVLPNQAKKLFTPYYLSLWQGGKKPYRAHAYQLNKLKNDFSMTDYQAMMRRIKSYSNKPRDLPSTSAYYLLDKFSQPQTKWLDDIMDKEKNR